MDSALGKSENKCQEIPGEFSKYLEKNDNFIQKDIHNSKLKFWGLT